MLVRHSAFYFVARGLPGLIGFATVAIYTRLLLPAAYGQYALIVTAAVVVNCVFYQWINASLVRFLTLYKDDEANLLRTVLHGFVFMSFLVGVGGALVVFVWGSEEWNALIWICIVLIWAQAWFAINLELARGRLAPVRYGLIGTLKAVVALSVGAVLVFSGLGSYGALIGLLVGFLAAGFWSSRNQWVPIVTRQFDRQLVAKLIGYGLPLTASFALAVVISSTDRFMLAGLIDPSATGLYSAGQSLAQQAVAVSMMIVNLAAYPIILQTLQNSGPKAARKQLRENVILMLGVGLPIAATFIILAPNIAHTLLGAEFRSAGIELLPWFAVATVLASTRAYYFDLAFYLGKQTHIQMAVMGLAALTNVGLNFLLIPVYGLLGAIYASVASHGIAFLLSAILGQWAFRMPRVYDDVGRLLLAVTAMSAALYVIPPGETAIWLAMSISIGGLVYVLTLYVVNPVGLRHTVKDAFRRLKSS